MWRSSAARKGRVGLARVPQRYRNLISSFCSSSSPAATMQSAGCLRQRGTGSQGEQRQAAGGLSGPVRRWGAHGPHSCMWPTPEQPPASPPTPLKPGVTVPALKREQLAAARVACSYRPDSLPDVFRSNSSQPASQPAARPASEPGTHSDCKTRSRVGKNKNKKSRGGGEKTGRCFSLTTPPT